jgi:hypothetical protein
VSEPLTAFAVVGIGVAIFMCGYAQAHFDTRRRSRYETPRTIEDIVTELAKPDGVLSATDAARLRGLLAQLKAVDIEARH